MKCLIAGEGRCALSKLIAAAPPTRCVVVRGGCVFDLVDDDNTVDAYEPTLHAKAAAFDQIADYLTKTT